MLSDAVYRTSSQYRLFSFPSPEALSTHRQRNILKSAKQLSGSDSSVEYLTSDEEIELVDYYVSKLWDFCRLFKVSSQIKVSTPACPEKLTWCVDRPLQQATFYGTTLTQLP